MFKNITKQQEDKSLNICCNYDYLELLFGASLPLDQVCYAFAYGSGAIPQRGENLAEKMVDFILVCNNSMLFHQKNQLLNPAHYSLPWRLLKTERLLNNLYWFQRDGFLFPKGAKLFYNTMIPTKGRLIKYGVIDTEDFEADLLDWPKLYIAGRLHKPVLNVLVWPNNQNLGQQPNRPIWQAINDNRWMAVQASLLMLPEKFKIKEFLQRIVSLSYKGDIRMGWAEDEKKIEKLVEGGKEQLKAIYIPLLKRFFFFKNFYFFKNSDKQIQLNLDEQIEQDISIPTMFHRLQMLPYYVQKGLCNSYYPSRRFRRYNNNLDIEELIFHISHRYDLPERLDFVLQKIVGQSSRHQSFKNALTAGISRSIKYIWPKLTKGILLRK